MPQMSIKAKVNYPVLKDSGDVTVPLSSSLFVPNARRIIAGYSAHAQASSIVLQASYDGGTTFVDIQDSAGDIALATSTWRLVPQGLLSDGALVQWANGYTSDIVIRYLYEVYE